MNYKNLFLPHDLPFYSLDDVLAGHKNLISMQFSLSSISLMISGFCILREKKNFLLYLKVKKILLFVIYRSLIYLTFLV